MLYTLHSRLFRPFINNKSGKTNNCTKSPRTWSFLFTISFLMQWFFFSLSFFFFAFRLRISTGFNCFVEIKATWTNSCRLETWKYHVGWSSKTTIQVRLPFTLSFVYNIKSNKIKAIFIKMEVACKKKMQFINCIANHYAQTLIYFAWYH